jgi:superfamily I DNA/RNA helicase
MFTNKEVTLLEQELMKKNIPFQLTLDTLSFLNKKEIKETLSFL